MVIWSLNNMPGELEDFFEKGTMFLAEHNRKLCQNLFQMDA